MISLHNDRHLFADDFVTLGTIVMKLLGEIKKKYQVWSLENFIWIHQIQPRN